MALPATAWGALGVLAFSGTIPATRLALPAFGPVLVGLGRAVVAATLAAAALLANRAPVPTRAQWRRVAGVTGGVVIGFPALSAPALRVVGASHAAVLVGLLPAATAVVAVLRAGERPRPVFWVASGAGTAAVVAFAMLQGAGSLGAGDLLLLAAVAAAAVGYAEGAVLSRQMPGWQVICWALLLAVPLLVPTCAVAAALDPPGRPDAGALFGFGYVAVISMFLGFFPWYRGLARGGVARVGQIQLAQPVLTMVWAALFLGEHPGPDALVAALAVLACTLVSTRVARAARDAGARVTTASGTEAAHP